MGWVGHERELTYALGSFGCDKDEDGKFKVAGTIVSFMGAGEEIVAGEDAVAFIDGKPVGIAALMSATSYGMRVKVF